MPQVQGILKTPCPCVLDQSERGHHFVQWFVNGVNPFFVRSLAVQSVCSLNVTDISPVILPIQYSLHIASVFLIGPGCCNDSVVGVTSGLENGVDVCCKLEVPLH
jgi:hypothetical protein